MRIIRASYEGHSFYARLDEETVTCLDKNRNLPDPIPMKDIRVQPLAVPSKIVCLCRNYPAHAAESGNATPEEPVIFLKPPTAVIGAGMPIVLPPMSAQVDFEGELAVVMGRPCKNIRPEDVRASIFGFTCANDVTARDLQKKDGQFTRAKGFDTFAPIGPWIETEVPDPGNLRIRTFVGDELRQDGTTADMVFSVEESISFISRIMTLIPGDVILTGTPSGVGPLKNGDIVNVDIEGVGSLVNPVMATPGPMNQDLEVAGEGEQATIQ